MTDKICIVTGANSGIGKQAVIKISQEGYHVVMACRNKKKGEEALDEIRKVHPTASVELQIIDQGLRESVENFVKEFQSKYNRLDVLIHNAAIFSVTQKEREVTAEGMETYWATNHLGPVLLTRLLSEELKRSEQARIITISSKGLLAKPFMKIDWADVEFQHKKFNVVNAYYQTKLAQIIFTLWLADYFRDTKITVNSIRVPAVKVDVSRHADLSPFMKWVYLQKAKNSLSPERMAETYTALAVSDEFNKKTGKYFDENLNTVSLPKFCRNPKNIEKTMALTKKYLPETGDF